MGIYDKFDKRLVNKKLDKPKPKPQPQPQPLPSTYWGARPPSTSSGGLPMKWIMIFIGIILLGGGIFAVFLFTPVGTMLRGPTFQMQYSAGSFMSSFGVQKMINQLMNPFAVQPTEAQTEQPNKNAQYNQIRESLSLKATVIPDTVEVDTTPFQIYLNINNEGTETVNKLWFAIVPKPDDDYSLDSLGAELGQLKTNNINVNPSELTKIVCDPFAICNGSCSQLNGIVLKDPDICNPNYINDMNGHYLLYEYDHPLSAGGSVAIPITNIVLKTGGNDYSTTKVAIPFFARVFTYYAAASRLPVTFINDNYATLLYQMGKFHYSEVPATAMAGTALKINLDAGQQPISSSTSKIVVLASFENQGKGKLFGTPILFLVYPKSPFTSRCNESYYTCDSAVANSKFCDKNGLIYNTLGGFAKEELEWVCNTSANPNSQFHVCMVDSKKANLKEFKTFSCTLDTKVDMLGSKRQTYYITAFAVYPYEYGIPLVINAYKLKS